MRLDYNALGKPMLKIEKEDVQIEISFADVPSKENVKQTILDLLTVAYEKRVTV